MPATRLLALVQLAFRCALLIGASLPLAALADDAPPAHDGARQRATVIVPGRMRAAYDQWGYAPAIVTSGGLIYVSGVVVVLEGNGTYAERYAAGLRTAIRRLGEVLTSAGASLDDVVKINSFHTDLARQIDIAVKVRQEMMAPPHPAWTAVGTPALAVPDGVTEIEVVAEHAARDGEGGTGRLPRASRRDSL